MNQTLVNTPIGQLNIVADEHALYKLEWLDSTYVNASIMSNALTKNIGSLLAQYFLNANINFSVPFAKAGTPFQRRVWQYLQTIPVGETLSYSEVAEALSTSPRAVGNACRANPFVIIVPCHRVVSKSGIGGYSGQTAGNKIAIKQWLLVHERY